MGLAAENRATEQDRIRAPSRARADKRSPSAFVELIPVLPAAFPQCTIEWEQPSGIKMTISLRGAHGADLLALIASLWRAGR